MKRIICIGNRYAPQDAAGSQVYERLLQSPLPPDVKVIDGGFAGLNLVRFVQGAEQVVFVDQVAGPDDDGDTWGEVVVLEAADMDLLAESRHGHSAGLAYLLRILPEVCLGAVPRILVVGIRGQPDEEIIDRAAALALQVLVEDVDRVRALSTKK